MYNNIKIAKHKHYKHICGFFIHDYCNAFFNYYIFYIMYYCAIICMLSSYMTVFQLGLEKGRVQKKLGTN